MKSLLQVFALGVFLAAVSFGQQTSITGTVSDPTGAVIPAATITLFNA